MIFKALNSFDGGFTIRLINDTTGTEITTISQYELSRNNIRGKDVKAVKAYNYGNTADLFITGSNDRVIFGAIQGGVQPFYLGNGDLIINAFWATPNTKEFIFYYDLQNGYIFDLIP